MDKLKKIFTPNPETQRPVFCNIPSTARIFNNIILSQSSSEYTPGEDLWVCYDYGDNNVGGPGFIFFNTIEQVGEYTHNPDVFSWGVSKCLYDSYEDVIDVDGSLTLYPTYAQIEWYKQQRVNRGYEN
jgi:hypothetical protein